VHWAVRGGYVFTVAVDPQVSATKVDNQVELGERSVRINASNVLVSNLIFLYREDKGMRFGGGGQRREEAREEEEEPTKG